MMLADIFQQHGPTYQQQFGAQMLPSHYQAMQAIVQCRTAALGGHIYACDACDHREYRYHSCRNRHCPQCQGTKPSNGWLASKNAPVRTLLPAHLYPAGCLVTLGS